MLRGSRGLHWFRQRCWLLSEVHSARAVEACTDGHMIVESNLQDLYHSYLWDHQVCDRYLRKPGALQHVQTAPGEALPHASLYSVNLMLIPSAHTYLVLAQVKGRVLFPAAGFFEAAAAAVRAAPTDSSAHAASNLLLALTSCTLSAPLILPQPFQNPPHSCLPLQCCIDSGQSTAMIHSMSAAGRQGHVQASVAAVVHGFGTAADNSMSTLHCVVWAGCHLLRIASASGCLAPTTTGAGCTLI